MLPEIQDAGDNGEPEDTMSEEDWRGEDSIEGDSNEEESSEEWTTDSDYKRDPWVGFLNLKSLKAGMFRSWRYFNWSVEGCTTTVPYIAHMVLQETESMNSLQDALNLKRSDRAAGRFRGAAFNARPLSVKRGLI